LQSPPDPILAYDAVGCINQLQWSATQPDWIAITYDDTLEVLRVYAAGKLGLPPTGATGSGMSRAEKRGVQG
jgi:hypothetical protein